MTLSDTLSEIERRAKAATTICIKCGFTGRADAKGFHPNCGYLATNFISVSEETALALVAAVRERDAEIARLTDRLDEARGAVRATSSDDFREAWDRVFAAEKERDGASAEIARLEQRVRELEETADSKAGKALRAVRACFQKRADWTVASIVCEVGGAVSTKQVYNALGYLTRHKQVERLQYGKYRLLASTTGERG